MQLLFGFQTWLIITTHFAREQIICSIIAIPPSMHVSKILSLASNLNTLYGSK